MSVRLAENPQAKVLALYGVLLCQDRVSREISGLGKFRSEFTWKIHVEISFSGPRFLSEFQPHWVENAVFFHVFVRIDGRVPMDMLGSRESIKATIHPGHHRRLAVDSDRLFYRYRVADLPTTDLLWKRIEVIRGWQRYVLCSPFASK